MARPSMLMTLVVLALLSLQSVDAAGRPAKLQVVESRHSVQPSKYIVQFSRPPAADRRAQARVGASASTLKSGAEQQHDDFAVYCRRNRLPVKISRRYSTLFNGAAVQVDNEQDLAKLAASPAVKKIFPVVRYSQTPQQPRPLNAKTVVPQFAHALTGVDEFRKQYPDVTGRDVKVAVVDSGIDWKHPAFAVPGQTCETFKGPGCRVLYGQDFVGSDYDANTPGKNIPKPDSDPMDDCNGHGVHCAGIIGGSDGTIQGVATGTIFGAYKVFGCKGSVDNDVILSALEAAYQDGMEIINLSLGGGRVTSDYPEAQAIDTLVANDVFVVAAASNDGDEGYSTVTSPSIASKGLSIASFDNTHQYVASAKFGGVAGLTDNVAFVYSGSEGITGKFDESQSFKVIRSPNGESDQGDGCVAFASNTFADGVALIRRGKCAFTQKALAAKAAGAAGVIIYNGQQGPMGGGILDPAELATYPVAFISGTPGFQIYEAAKSGAAVTVKFNNKEQFVAAETAGRPSDFSSWGLDLSLFMKPDMGAPGGHIYSAYPRALGSYAELSGTSMATPYMAGVIALEIQRNGASKGLASYESLQRRLHITSRPALLPGSDPKNPVAESVAKTGAGLVNVPALLANPLDVIPSKLELGDGFAAKTRTITVTNNGNRAKRYTIGHLPSRSVEGSNGVATAGFQYSNTFAKVSFSSQLVAVAPGQSASFVVTVDPVSEQNAFWIRSGFITLTDASDEKPELSIPYALLANDYGKYPIFDSTFMPALVPGGAIDDPSIPPFEEDAKPTFDLKTKETSPAVFLSTVFPVRRLTVALVPADKPTNVLGYLLVDDFAQKREATAIVLNAEVQDINDETKAVPVEDGEYRLVIQYVRPTALKVVADPKAALENMYVSPAFIINKSGVITTTSTSATATSTETSTATSTETSTTATSTETSTAEPTTTSAATETSTAVTTTSASTETSTAVTTTSAATETSTAVTTTSAATETSTAVTTTQEPTTTSATATATSTDTSSLSTATETSTAATTTTQAPTTTVPATSTSASTASTSTSTSTSTATTTTTTAVTSTETETSTTTGTATSTSVEPEPTYVYGKRPPGYGKRPKPTPSPTAAPEPVYGKRPKPSPTAAPEPVYGKRPKPSPTAEPEPEPVYGKRPRGGN